MAFRRHNQVKPISNFDVNYRILQIRPKRWICIHYYNPCPRENDLEKQIHSQLLQQDTSGRDFRLEVFPHFLPIIFKSENQNILSSQIHVHKDNHSNGATITVKNEPSRVKSADIRSPTELTMVSEDGAKSKTEKQENSNQAKEGIEFLPLPDCSKNVKHSHTVIFLIHGVGGSSDVWKGQIKHFEKEGYTIVVPEWIGHGLCPSSNRAKDYYFDEIKNDLLLVFDLHCSKVNIVIGHSYGSCFASVLARMRPRLVNKLMLISGGSPTPLSPQAGLFKLPSCVLACWKPVLKGCFLQRAFHKKSKTVVPRERVFDVPSSVMKMTMNGQIWPEGDADYHNRICCLTYIIHGAEDQLISVDEEIDMRDCIFGSLLFVIEESSHMVMMEKPEEVNRYIEIMISDGCDDRSSDRNVVQPSVTLNEAESSSFKEQYHQVTGSGDSISANSTPTKTMHSLHVHNETVNNVPSEASSKHSTPQHIVNSPSRQKSAKSIPDRLFSAKKRKLPSNQ